MGKVPKGVSGKSIGNTNNAKRGRSLGGGGRPPRKNKGCALFLIALLGLSAGAMMLSYALTMYFIA